MSMHWSWVVLLAACGDLAPPTVAPTSDAETRTDGTSDDEVIEGVTCETDQDCTPYGGCCIDPRCRQGVCIPFYVPSCCTTPGPCATATPFHSGTCESSCVAYGCSEAWSPPSGSCAEVLQAARFDVAGLTELTLQDTNPNDRVAWAPSEARPFAGRASLHAGDVACPTYYGGPLGADCHPLDPQVDGNPIRLVMSGATITLPTDRPSVAEVWLWIDVGVGHIDGLVLEVQRDGFGPVALWDSRAASPAVATWFPVVLDLSPFAGQRLRVALTFDTFDGRDNDHEGVYLGALALRTMCADDRVCPAASACTLGRETQLVPLSETVCVVAPADPGPACVPCQSAATCPISDSCDVARCDAGVCQVGHVLDAACCTPDVTWPGDGSFEGPLDGWEVGPGWGVSPVRSLLGESALHFGLADGSGIALPDSRAAGTVWSPAFDLPLDAPVWSFGLYLATEWDDSPSRANPSGVDLLEVLVRPDAAQAPPATVWSSTVIGGTTRGHWDRVRVDLSAWAGRRVRVGFRFDTGDEYANDADGAFIDDTRVFRVCPGCGPDRVGAGCDPGPVEP